MTSDGSITGCFRQLSQGDGDAVRGLWERYFVRLTELARRKLAASRNPMADEEDVVLCAFDTFWRGAQLGKFAEITNRNELWKLLSTITQRKALDHLAHQRRQKRDVGRQGAPDHNETGSDAVQEIASREPSPDQAVQFAEQVRGLLDCLPSAEYRQIALLRLDGETIESIAVKLDRGHATIERKLRAIRALWEEQR